MIYIKILRIYRWLLRRLKPLSGLTTLSRLRPVKALFARIPPEQTATMTDGTPIQVDVRDYHGRILWLFGCNDFKVAGVAAALSRPGDVFLDIGANYGTIGMTVRHALGAEGRAHLFEPQPGLAGRVREAVAAARGGAPVTLHEVALFERDGVLELSVPALHSGKATLMGHGERFKRGVAVPVTTRETAAYVAPLVAGRRFGVKIDIEGAELAVLPALLDQPGVAFCVFEGDRNQRELFDLFTQRGWAIYGLPRTIFAIRLERVAAFEDWRRFHDFVAVRTAGAAPTGVLRPAALAAAIAGR